jgi:exosome complex component RRP42
MKLKVNLFQDDFRNDGRSRRDFRPIELETNVIASASGSARFCLANSDIIVGIKPEIDVPLPNKPNEGKIEFFVDCSANALLDFEGRGGEELALEISNCLRITYTSPSAFDLKSLCILPKHQCWKLYVDILILQCAGNLYDAISLAVKCALYNLRIPRVSSALLDGGNVDLVLSDDIHDCDRLNTETAPILVTVCKIGESCVVDPSIEEEICSTGSAVIGVSGDKITTIKTISGGSLHPETLDTCIDLAMSTSRKLNEQLLIALKQEECQVESNRDAKCSFLK